MDKHHPSQPSPGAASSSALLEALRQPFAPQEVRLSPGECRQTAEGGSWVCLALPGLPYRLLKARLDHLLPGKWGASFAALQVTGNRLVASVQVRLGTQIYDASYDVPFKQATLLTETHELLTSVPEAFEQAFILACARFGLGQYVNSLARKWVPYDAQQGRLALTAEEQRAHVLKLYQLAGLPVAPPAGSPAAKTERPSQTSAPVPEDPVRAERAREGAGEPAPSSRPTREALRARDLAWVRQQCAAHPGSLAKILQRWHVINLDVLSDDELAAVINNIHRANARPTLPNAS